MRTAVLALIALGAASCDRDAEQSATQNAPAPRQVDLPAQAPASQIPALVPRPKDQAQLDRMILAGYTPHADHLHAPGVNECPMSKGTEAVM